MFLVISFISFTIIQLPPGDFITTKIAQLAAAGDAGSAARVELLREQYGLTGNFFVRYWNWLSGIVVGDFGVSAMFEGAQVSTLIADGFLFTILLGGVSLAAAWGLAIAIGIYSATHRYGIADYSFTFLGFIGLAVPPFLTSLLYVFAAVFIFGADQVGGLYSPEFRDAPWSWARLADLAQHMWFPVGVLTLAGMAGTMRIMRGSLLDVLNQQYIATARAKGLPERTVILKHGARVAINPLISRLSMIIPDLFSNVIIVSVVLNLPTLGPLFLRSLLGQDMYVAGAILLILAVFVLVGNLLADLALAWSDPRIRLE
ncbi:MAG TPA: ABC transporter permease [Devosia sp.]|nr:ABC transporter permease [Devosia sp.]